MEESKAWYQSIGVWGGVTGTVAGVAGLFGYTISPEDQANVANALSQTVTLVSSLAALGGGLAAIFGRVRASKAIGKA